jgi:hypothetical protein
MKGFRKFAVLGGACAFAAAVAPTIMAYATFAKWGSSSASFYVNPANADVSQNAAISALQTAMDAWNTQSGTPFRLLYAGQVSNTSTGYDNKNLILFRNDSNGSAIASTYSWWTSSNTLVDSDIVFWDGGRTFFSGTSGCSNGAYIEDVATHELGHAIGLSHSTQPDATMYTSYSTCSQSLRTLSADDISAARSLYGTGGTTDTAPTVTITAPASGATVPLGTALTFSGSASDTPDGNVSSYLVWRSNLDGQIGLGASFSKTLTAGSHTITASVTDSTGHTASVTRSVTVTSGNTSPSVSISSPAGGTTVAAGTSLTFTGTATDSQDGNLTSALIWQSNIDGRIGTGGSFTRTLTAGTHSITATVTDTGGLVGQASRTVTVSASTTSAAPKLTARGYKEKGMQKVDLSWEGLSTTNVDIYRSNTKVKTTSNNGNTTDPIDKKGNGSYTYKVCAAGSSTCTNQQTVSF